MPAVQILFYRDPGEAPPVLEWLLRLQSKQLEKVRELLDRLAAEGHELRRPHADLLRDGIYELRASYQNQQNRILYFFDGQGLVIVAHGLKKEDRMPEQAIDLARLRRERFRTDPVAHCVEVDF
jgi:phage-related protein